MGGQGATIDRHLLLQGGQEGGAALLLHSLHADALAHVGHQLPQERAEVLCAPDVARYLHNAQQASCQQRELPDDEPRSMTLDPILLTQCSLGTIRRLIQLFPPSH